MCFFFQLDSELEDGFYLRGGRTAVSTQDLDSNNAFDLLAGKGCGVRRANDVMNPMLGLVREVQRQDSLHSSRQNSAAPSPAPSPAPSEHGRDFGTMRVAVAHAKPSVSSPVPSLAPSDHGKEFGTVLGGRIRHSPLPTTEHEDDSKECDWERNSSDKLTEEE